MFASFISPELFFQALLPEVTPLMVVSAAALTLGAALLTASVQAMRQAELGLPGVGELQRLGELPSMDEAGTLF